MAGISAKGQGCRTPRWVVQGRSRRCGGDAWVFSGCIYASVAQMGGVELLPGRQIDDDGDECFKHGVFSDLVSYLGGGSVPGKGLGNGQGCGS